MSKRGELRAWADRECGRLYELGLVEQEANPSKSLRCWGAALAIGCKVKGRQALIKELGDLSVTLNDAGYEAFTEGFAHARRTALENFRAKGYTEKEFRYVGWMR